MTATKLAPKPVSKFQAQLWQKLISSRRHLRVSALDREWHFQFVLEMGRKDMDILSKALDVDIRLGNHIGTVRCALLPDGFWLSEILRGSTIEAIHEPFRTAVTGVILQDFFQGLSRSSRLPLQLLQTHSTAASRGISLYWQMLNDRSEAEIIGSLTGNESLLSEICNAATTWPSLPWRLPDSLQVSVEVLADSLLVQQDCTCFALGDVFLLGEFEKWKEGSLLLRTQYNIGDGSLVPIKLPRSTLEDTLFLTRNLNSEHFSNAQQKNQTLAQAANPNQQLSSRNMSEVEHDEEAPSEHSSWSSSAESGGGETRWIDSVEVILEFSLGRHTMSLGELKRLGQGHIFPIKSTANGLVNIVLQGKNIGKGELVQIGEAVGVLVRELGNIPDSAENQSE
ncbi:MAG: hypothetical protein C5B47_03805 [Verrucomicrobia bacterium]|nr:MAG: hypothetical protein C5B47_03805 [Verrucomicrobiota bacterium]